MELKKMEQVPGCRESKN